MANLLEVIFGVKNAPLRSGLQEAKALVSDFRKEASQQLAGALTFGGIAAAIGSIISYADRVQDLSDVYGVSTTILQQWGEAAEENASSAEAVAASFNKVIIAQSTASGGSKEMVDAFAALGVSLDDVRALSPDELMLAIGRGSMDAAALVQVLGRNALELRPVLKGLADGSIEMGRAISENAVQGLADMSDGMKALKQDMTVGGGTVLVFLGNIARTAFAASTAMMPLIDNAKELITIGKQLGHGDKEGAKSTASHMGDAWIARAKAIKDTISEAWNPPKEDKGDPIDREGKRNAVQEETEEAISLTEKLASIRREAALEGATDQEKLLQLLDQEEEARIRAGQAIAGSEDELENLVTAEQARLDAMKLQASMSEKQKQQTDRETKERETLAERREKENTAAAEKLREDENELSIMEEKNRAGDAAASRLQTQLDYERKIADIGDKILQARKDGNEALAETLTKQQQIIAQQASLANDPASQAFQKNGGRAPRVSALLRENRAQAKRTEAEEKFRNRLTDGLIPTRRDISGKPTHGIDPLTGEERAVRPENYRPPKPGAGVQAPGQEKNTAGQKLDEIKTVLVNIENKLDKPLTH